MVMDLDLNRMWYCWESPRDALTLARDLGIETIAPVRAPVPLTLFGGEDHQLYSQITYLSADTSTAPPGRTPSQLVECGTP